MSRKPYPSDVTEEEWEFVTPYLTLMSEDSPQREHDLREVFNGMRWIVRTGSPRRYMAKGVRLCANSPDGFNDPEAMVTLGVGKNMVRSIRFWCLESRMIIVAPQDHHRDPERRSRLIPAREWRSPRLSGRRPAVARNAAQ
jgi:hypothetical protein